MPTDLKSRREKISKALENLKILLELPKLYLSNYFSDLRNQVDKEISLDLIKEEKKKRQLNKLWKQMIEKIDSFEKQCIKNPITNTEAINQKLDSIEEVLSKQETNNFDEIHQEIIDEEINVLKQLFQNRTIVFVNLNDLCNLHFAFVDKYSPCDWSYEATTCYIKKNLIQRTLLIINDKFIRKDAIER